MPSGCGGGENVGGREKGVITPSRKQMRLFKCIRYYDCSNVYVFVVEKNNSHNPFSCAHKGDMWGLTTP